VLYAVIILPQIVRNVIQTIFLMQQIAMLLHVLSIVALREVSTIGNAWINVR